LRILKVYQFHIKRIAIIGCRDIDPVEDTESFATISCLELKRCCRDIDPVEDTER